MNLPWRQTWNQRNFVLNKPSTCYLLTQSPQQSWVGSNAYYHFATRKLRLREVKWLTPCHTELRFHTQDSARCSGALMPRGHQPQGRCRGELASPQRGPLTLVLLESLHHLLQGLYLPSLQQGGGRGAGLVASRAHRSPFRMGRACLKSLSHPGCSHHSDTSDEPFCGSTKLGEGCGAPPSAQH